MPRSGVPLAFWPSALGYFSASTVDSREFTSPSYMPIWSEMTPSSLGRIFVLIPRPAVAQGCRVIRYRVPRLLNSVRHVN